MIDVKKLIERIEKVFTPPIPIIKKKRLKPHEKYIYLLFSGLQWCIWIIAAYLLLFTNFFETVSVMVIKALAFLGITFVVFNKTEKMYNIAKHGRIDYIDSKRTHRKR